MTTKLARLNTPSSEKGAERRRAPRYPTWTEATLHSMQGKTFKVMLVDVSAHGCSVRLKAGDLRAGNFVSVGFADEPPLQAIIRWVRNGSAGMEFLRPIPPERSDWLALMDSPFDA